MSGIVKPPYPAQIDWSHPLSRGLVAYWLFGEGSGTGVHDITGNGWDGEFRDGFDPTEHWVASQQGWCADCGSYDDNRYVQIVRAIGSPGVLKSIEETTGQCTITGWAKFEDYGAERFPCMLGEKRLTSPNYGYDLGTNTGNDSWRWRIMDTDTLSAPISYGWHFLAGTIGHAGMYLYVDGELVDSNASATSMYAHSYGTGDTCIANNSYRGHDGLVDPIYVSVYNRALSASEIRQLYANPYQMLWQPQPPIWIEEEAAGVDITATVLEATGSMPSPTATGGASISAPTMTATTSAPAPGATGAAAVTAAVLDAVGDMISPGVAGGAAIDSAVLDGSASIPSPDIKGGANIDSAVLDAIGDMVAPGVTGGATVTSAILEAIGNLVSPDVAGGATIASAVLDATGTIPSPGVTGGADVDSVVLDGIAEMPAPEVTGAAAVTVQVMSAVASIPAPTVAFITEVVAAVLSATTSLPAPTVAGNANIDVEVITTVATLIAPDVSTAAAIARETIEILHERYGIEITHVRGELDIDHERDTDRWTTS